MLMIEAMCVTDLKVVLITIIVVVALIFWTFRDDDE